MIGDFCSKRKIVMDRTLSSEVHIYKFQVCIMRRSSMVQFDKGGTGERVMCLTQAPKLKERFDLKQGKNISDMFVGNEFRRWYAIKKT